MNELTIFLLVAFILLAIVAVIGHGIWVLVAAMFGAGRRASPPLRPNFSGDSPQTCPRCRAGMSAIQQVCSNCNWPYKTTLPQDGVAALKSLRRQLDVFREAGTLDADTWMQLTVALVEQERMLKPQPVVAPPQPIEPATIATIPEVVAAIPQPEPTAILPTIVESPTGPAAPPISSPSIPAAATIGDRARRYSESRTAAMGDMREPIELAATTPAPPKQREALSRLFAAFMEEKNIRWGELVGGLLIVGCSIALVISFWSQIAAQPLLKFVLFNGVTAALFGIGIYTDRRWKIHTTSHGLLVISTLLVPLNFLAIAAFTQASPPTDFLSLAGEGFSITVFAALVCLAGRILVPADSILLAVGVMIPSLMQLLVRRFAGPSSGLSLLYSLATAPVLAYVATVALATGRRWGATSDDAASLTELEANRTLIFAGLVSAAAIMPLALLLHNVPPMLTTLHWLSPLGILCGLPALLVGLLFWRRLNSATHTGLQTSGIAIGVLGALVMIAAIVFAWPDPATLLPTTLLAAALLVAVATWFDIPAAHLPAGIAIAVAWLVGFHFLWGDVGWTVGESTSLRGILFSAGTGHMLEPLAIVMGAVAAWLYRTGRREASLMYSIVAAAVAIVSLALVVRFGFGHAGDPEYATWTLAFYAVATLAAALALDRGELAGIGSALLLAALGQGIVFGINPTWQLERPWIVTLLTHATAVGLGCAILFNVYGVLPANVGDENHSPSIFTKRRHRSGSARNALGYSALITSIAAAIGIFGLCAATSAAALCAYLAWLAGVWIVLAFLLKSEAVFTASQVSVVFAILCGVTAFVSPREWYTTAPHPWLDPWFIEAQGLALGAYAILFAGIRWLVAACRQKSASDGTTKARLLPRLRETSAQLLTRPWWSVDRIVPVVVATLAFLVALYAVMPGAAQELSPTQVAGERIVTSIEQFEIAGIAHEHASDGGAWVLLGVAALAAGVQFPKQLADWRRVALAGIGIILCLLLAPQWESQVAVASSLRWLSAGLLAIASMASWVADRSTTASPTAAARQSSRTLRDLLVAFVLLVYIAMAAHVVAAVLTSSAATAISSSLAWWLAAWTAPTLMGALLMFLYARMADADAQPSAVSAKSSWYLQFRWAALLMAIAPAAIALAFAIAQVLIQFPLVGPEPTSWFRAHGNDFSFGAPLVVVALTFMGYAVRDRSPSFAFSAGLLFNIVATLVLLLRLARTSSVSDPAAWICVAQLNAVVAGIVALVWMSAMHAAASLRAANSSLGETRPRVPALLVSQVGLATALCGAFLIPATAGLALQRWLPSWIAVAGRPMGWIAVGLAAVSAVWLNGRRRIGQPAVALVAAVLVSMIGLTMFWRGGDGVHAYHIMLAGCCVAAWLVPFATRIANHLLVGLAAEEAEPLWSAWEIRVFDATAVALAIWEYRAMASWWMVGALAAIALRNIAVAWREGRRRSMWFAAMLAMFATSVWWLDLFHAPKKISSDDFLWINVLAAAAMAVVSVVVERRQQQNRPPGLQLIGLAFHRFAAWAIVATLLTTTCVGLIADLMESSFVVNQPLAWAAWLAAAIVAGACLWDSAIRWPVPCLYCVGLIAVGMYLDGLDLHAPMIQWALANALAAYSLATSGLWSVRDRLRTTATGLGIPSATESSIRHSSFEIRRFPSAWSDAGHAWLVPINILLGIAVLFLVFWIDMKMPVFMHRMVAAYAIGAQAFAIALLARGAVRTPLQYLSLLWGVFFAVAFGWALLPLDFPAPWLHRLVVTAVALAAVVVVYGFGFAKFLKRENEWTHAAGRLVPPLAVSAVALVFAVLAIEVRAFVRDGSVPIVPVALAAIIVALAGLTVASLVAALIPGRDPLGLSERGRTLYVYFSEALGGLLFLHVRVTMPWLFSGWFLRFWPLVVMAVAFVGVGFSEVFQRRKLRVLAEPLENTGALLPLLPAVGYWATTSEVHYSLLLLSIGVLYAALSALRQSFWYGLLAVLAANGSLWYYLHEHEGLNLTQHPQLWLIPPALCALAAGYINRERLKPEQSSALRYAAAIVIYVSSTADIFINGVAEAPWLPGVLAGLSILGVLAGILLRVQSFLYLGVSFLVVAIMTIIWHAAEGHTWIWWLTGIVTGVLIIALFGLFEKRRDDVLRVVEQLKHWET